MSEEVKGLKLPTLLEQLRLKVESARTLPLSSKVMLEKGEMTALLRELHESLPEDVQTAKQVLAEKERLLTESSTEAEKTLREAREEAQRTVDDAKASAEKTLREAAEEAAAKLNDATTRSGEMLADASARANAALAEATQQAQAMVADAEERAAQMTEESTIMQNARAQADQLLNATRQDCQAYSLEVRQNMMSLIDAANAGLEEQLNNLRAYRDQMNNA